MARSKPRKVTPKDPPRKHVLLLSCMDTRLLDDSVRFMNSMNLQNRYDHLIFAGAGMGVRRLESPSNQPNLALPWKNVFFDHLVAAIELLKREVKDIFILEHLDCGAYKELHPDPKVKSEYSKARPMSKQVEYHRKEARAIAKEINDFCRDRHETTGSDAWKEITVRCFVMDLMGEVQEIG